MQLKLQPEKKKKKSEAHLVPCGYLLESDYTRSTYKYNYTHIRLKEMFSWSGRLVTIKI